MSLFIDLASDALTEIGQLGTGQTISPEQANQCMRLANRFLGKWSTQRLWIFNTPRVPFTLTPGIQDYTIGPTGGFVRSRPVFIGSGEISGPGGGLTLPLSVLDPPKWQAIRDKGATCSPNGLPQDMWPEYTYPNITVHFWTIPSSASIATLAIWELLQQFATVYDTLNFPPGYEEAIVQMLAMELAPYYDMPITPAMQSLAGDAMASVQRINAQGLGGALAESQTLMMPNLSQPQPSGPPQAGG